MPKERMTWIAWLATLVLFTLCLLPKALIPFSEGPKVNVSHLDKLVHFGMFAWFGLLWTLAGRSSLLVRGATMFLVVVALAVGTELAQGIPLIDRDPDPLDAVADVIGGVCGIVLALGFVRSRGGSGSRSDDLALSRAEA